MKKGVVLLYKEQLAIDCAVQNIKVFLEQSKERNEQTLESHANIVSMQITAISIGSP